MSRLLYTLMLYAMLPLALMRLVWRARRQRGYLHHVAERFGFFPGRSRAEPLLWIHAVSVGETRAAEPLVNAMCARYPQHRILITHMTPTGRATGEQLYADRVERCYLPYDYPGGVQRFLAHYRPVAGVLMETEIWPNLIHAAAARGTPLYLVNARLSEKSYARYRRYPRLTGDALRGLACIAAQTEDDVRRFTALGARRVSVMGSLKFDVVPPADMLALGKEWRARYGGRPVLLAASTRAGEEELLLDALDTLGIARVLLVIVPRHPDRFGEVAALLDRHGIAYQRRSANERTRAATRVVLGDSMGEMFAYYAACDVAYVGGSLLPYGSQNLIEACAVGKPVLLGPHTYNFAEAAELAIAAGAALRVADADELMKAAQRVLADPRIAARMGEAGLRFCRAHQGATLRALELMRF